MRLSAAALAAVLACAGRSHAPAPLPAGLDDRAARETLARFAHALDAGRFDEAQALLSERWRSAYTPGRLALDFAGAGPAAREAAGRVLATLEAGGAPEVRGGAARLALGNGRGALLVAEGGAWRVDALE